MYRAVILTLTHQKRLSLLIVIISAVMCVQSISKAQDKTKSKDPGPYVQAAVKAYEAKDYPTLIENLKTALSLRPTYRVYIYYLAKGYALSGNKTEALKWLNEGADMGLVYGASADKDFDSIKDSDEFKAVLAKIENNKAHKGNSELAFTMSEKGLITEGLAYDPVEKAFYVSCVYKRKIVKIDSKGLTSDFAANQNELWSGMGMKVDAKARVLWAATAAHPQMANYKEEDNGKTAVLKYDLTTGKLIKRYDVSNKPKPHWFGDLTINNNGDVYASDSLSPEIYVIRPGSDQIELFLQSDEFVNCQGVAFSPDGSKMFMADYLTGLFVIDVKTKKITNLGFLPHTTMLGMDGIYFYKGSLIAVQNGVTPHRIIRVYLNDDYTKLNRVEIIEANHPAFNEPTLGVIVDDTFYYNAASQWAAISEKGELAPMDKLKEHTILKVKL